MLNRFVLIAFAMIATSALAAPTTAPSDESTVTRVYDVSDLLWSKNDYKAPQENIGSSTGGGGGGGQSLFAGQSQAPDATPQPSRQDLVNNLIKLLTDTIAPETWKDNGGSL